MRTNSTLAERFLVLARGRIGACEFGLHSWAKLVAGTDVASKRVLDVGCGAGWFALYLLTVCGANEVVALDSYEGHGAPSANYDLFLTNIANLGLKRIRVIKADFMGNGLPDRSFEVISVLNVLHHIHATSSPLAQDQAAWQTFSQVAFELNRLLKPEGHLLIEESMPCNLSQIIKSRNRNNVNWSTKHWPGEWINLLQENGFADFRISYLGPYVLARRVPPRLNFLAENRVTSLLSASAYVLRARRKMTATLTNNTPMNPELWGSRE